MVYLLVFEVYEYYIYRKATKQNRYRVNYHGRLPFIKHAVKINTGINVDVNTHNYIYINVSDATIHVPLYSPKKLTSF